MHIDEQRPLVCNSHIQGTCSCVAQLQPGFVSTAIVKDVGESGHLKPCIPVLHIDSICKDVVGGIPDLIVLQQCSHASLYIFL